MKGLEAARSLPYNRGVSRPPSSRPHPTPAIPSSAPEPLATAGGAPVRATYLPLAAPWIGEREKQLVMETLESGWITTGPKAQEFARRIADLEPRLAGRPRGRPPRRRGELGDGRAPRRARRAGDPAG